MAAYCCEGRKEGDPNPNVFLLDDCVEIEIERKMAMRRWRERRDYLVIQNDVRIE